MLIEEGKFYYTRAGKRVGPMERTSVDMLDDRASNYWVSEDNLGDCRRSEWYEDGRYFRNESSEWDLVSHSPKTHVWLSDGSVFDLTKNRVQCGLLTAEELEALKSWEGAYLFRNQSHSESWSRIYEPLFIEEYVYRACLEPVRVKHTKDKWLTPDGNLVDSMLGSPGVLVTVKYEKVNEVIDISTYEVCPK